MLSISSSNDFAPQYVRWEQSVPSSAQKGKFLPPLVFLRRPQPVRRHQAQAQTRLSSERSPLQNSVAQQQTEGLKVIGVGQRSSSIAARFLKNGIVSLRGTWHVDWESRAEDVPLIQQKLLLAVEKEYRWARGTDISDLLDCDAGGPGNASRASSQIRALAFVLVTASNSPGGPDSILCIVDALRAAGHFVAVAITMPFEFEGRRRMEMATSLQQALQKVANVVCVIQQNALMGITVNSNGSPMTVADATSIADNAQESFVKLVLAATEAPEVLSSSKGALIWEEQSSNQWHRMSALWLPLQQTLYGRQCSKLGRGIASMSADVLKRAPVGQSLMQLASDAVAAAADSPFLDSTLNEADTIVCTLQLPSTLPQGQWEHSCRQAAWRLACQAAAGALSQLSACKNVSVTYQTTPQAEAGSSVEASLLVLSTQSGPFMQGEPLKTPMKQETRSNTDKTHMLGRQQYKASRSQSSASHTWGQQMSAMAGGHDHAYAPEREQALMARHTQQCSEDVQKMITVEADFGSRGNSSIGDMLADNLIAQSLDLPPKAAKWRQAQRAKEEPPRMMVQAPEAAWQVQGNDSQDIRLAVKSILVGDNQHIDVRQRMFAILERDRDDSQ